ncbi:Histidine utilization repressor [Sphingomonas sp. EC-HK361]|uniref:UTRA domain-containing protein n=1 Tax=Sphingomonas sp. EC-HK361 TaxID=2038397 RepID=UPI001256EA73|nr:UTRA domain-containing protein [Sphingomonas sp. EC-HK361]VVT14442.1 Histidine utilization repressor [Sphingomonas sp. EC-HK361]
MTIERRIRSDIEARIHSGEWRPGDRIPFEHELVATYGCARATVGKALGTLARSGLIERRRKAGSFVAHPQVHSAVLAVPDLAEVITARGEAYRWQQTVRRDSRPDDCPDFPSPALLIEGVHCGGGEPFALERRLIVLAVVPDAAKASFLEEAPGTWLLRHVPWTTAEHQIKAVEASPAEARALGLRARSACLELRRTTWRAEETVTFVRQLFRGDRFDLVARFSPGTGSAAPFSGR